MANFCSKCGSHLGPDGLCPRCPAPAKPAFSGMFPNPAAPRTNPIPEGIKNFDTEKAAGFIEKVKNRMGIGDPDLNKGDAFEKDKLIIPDCVSANENEIPVKQYTVAKLRNRLFGITYSKAIGRIQVTNKRVIFRAPGRCPAGRTTLQHEFTIDEIAGIEARREYAANFSDLFLGTWVFAFALTLMFFILSNIDPDVINVLGLILGIALLIPFFVINKRWLLKLFINGLATTSLAMPLVLGEENILSLIFTVLAIAIFLANLVIYSIRPNLVLMVKTNAATDAAINIQRKKISLFGRMANGPENTGYTEVLPEVDAEKSIRELGAVINDIKTLGDFGIEKWRK